MPYFRPFRLTNDLNSNTGAAITLELAQCGARVAAHFVTSASVAEEVVHKIKRLENG